MPEDLKDKLFQQQEEPEEEYVDEEDTQKGRFMTFRCAGDDYGIGIEYVNEIIGIQNITFVPNQEPYVIGLINLRGKIVPVIDVRLRFRKEAVSYNARTCIIVISVDETTVGIIVDEIADVVTIREEDILNPPNAGSKGASQFIFGLGKIGEEVKLLVDPQRLIADKEPEDNIQTAN